MNHSTTAYNSSLPLATPSPQSECINPLHLTVAAINTISFFINIFHLAVITRLDSLKGTQYRLILINISLSDMANTLVVAVFYSCHNVFLKNFLDGEPALKIPIDTMMTSANYIGYHVFLVASIQKYLAICKPIAYRTSSFVNRLPAPFALSWTYIVLVNLSFCLGEVLFSGSQKEKFQVIRTVLLSIPPNVLTGILLTKVCQAMKVRSRVKAVRKKLNAPKVNAEVRNGAKYLMIIFTIEMMVFLLNVVCLIVTGQTGSFNVCNIWNGFIKAPYTIANTIIYGWRTEPYRRHVRRIFGCQSASIESV